MSTIVSICLRCVNRVALICVLLHVCCLEVTLAQSALCRGSLGDNIFTEGDFGRGESVLFEGFPGLAPGYLYTTHMPPNDGSYTISNNTSAWYRIWPTWLQIGDNSPDPKGYMMIVNASYDPGIFYEKTIDGVCENTLYEFSADVINLIQKQVRDHFYPNVSFLIDGVERYTTGPIGQTESWHTVGFTFTTLPGQTDVQLTLRNNAPGGYGNDLALDNISFRACGPHASIRTMFGNVVCENAAFPVLNADMWSNDQRVIQWQVSQDEGQTWSNIRRATTTRLQVPKYSAGHYQFRFAHAASQSNLQNAKCRAASEVFHLNVKAAEIRKSVTIDAGEFYTLGTRKLWSTGTYRERFPSETGCDSTVIVQLEVRGDEISADLMATSVTCFGAGDGSIRLHNVHGGAPPLNYHWNNGSHSATISRLTGGTYAVTITDARGMTFITSAVIEEPKPLKVVLSNTSHSAETKVTGGTQPYAYLWPDGSTRPKATGLTAGDHEMTVTDSRGCEASASVHIADATNTQAALIPDLSIRNLQSGRAIRMESVHFTADSSELASSSIPTLNTLYTFLLQHPGIVIEIGGHTNGLPEHPYCDALSNARAHAVADWIISQGIDSSRIISKGYGKRKPIATNQTARGRRLNQRVEIRLIQAIEIVL